jgi:competence protein ComEC
MRFRGFVADDPRPGADGPRLLVDAAPEPVGGSPAPGRRGRVLLQVLGDPAPPPAKGDAVVFRARLRPVQGFRNPGAGGYAAYLERQGVGARASAAWPGAVAIARPGEGAPWWVRLRQRLSAALARAVPGPEGGVLRALALGERGSLLPETAEAFRRSGTSHLVAISGLHLGLLALFLAPFFSALLIRIPGLPLAHPVPPLARVLTLPALGAYAALSGFQISTLRALVMVGLVVVGTGLSRPVAAPALLASTALVLGLGNPRALEDPGLHLSLAALGGLFWLAPRLERPFSGSPSPLDRLAPPGWAAQLLARAGRGFRSLLCTCVAAALATAPVSAYHFGGASALGLLVNPLAVPLVGFVCLPLALAGAVAEGLWPGAGWLAWKPAGAALRPLLSLQEALAPLAPHLTVPGLDSVLGVAGAFCLLGALGLGLSRPRPRRAVAVLFAAGLAAIALPEGVRRAQALLDRDAHLWTFDVGQGQAVGLRLPGNLWVVVDGAGIPGRAFDPGAAIVAPALQALGCRRLALAVSSHPHPDHLEGLPALVRWGRPREVWLPGSFEGDGRYARLLAEAAAAGARVRWIGPEGHADSLGAARLDARWFAEGRENDRSLALRVTVGGACALLPGDLEARGQERLVETGFAGPCDLLVAPHHGAANALYPPFLEAVRPQAVFVSAGGRPGLPAPTFLEALDAAGARACLTHRDGFLHARLGTRGLAVRCGD